LHRSSDAALALGVLAMIALMILPVRPWLLDLFLTLNLAGGAVLLMAAVLTPSGTRIYTFPTLLILATLYRLALDVSSTRLILTEAEAGQVIQSFGQFAAGGSVIIGLIVFLIITLVQLIVISKGAERTANATAIFVRESIPGRQMAIDADAAAQPPRISPAQLARARQQMAVEVEFYGRMYGAMEFIKGDAIAGLVLAAINIVGGLIQGIAVNHMPPGQAVETYTLLSVGAGLVSQIPALVGSVAGTILVSRVSSGDSFEGLGQTAAGQFFALPKAMILASVMLLVLAVVPGMPTVPFLVLAAFVGLVGYHFDKRAKMSFPDPVFPPAQMEVRLPVALPEQDVVNARMRAAALLEQHSGASGIPFPAWSFPRGVTHAPDRIAVLRRGREIASHADWRLLEAKLKEDMLLYPIEYFGLGEAYRWLDIAARGNEYPAGLLRARLKSAPPQAGPEPLYNFLRLLVEERVPINLSWDILNLLVAPKSAGNIVGTDESRLELADYVRQQLCENSARFYREHYWKDGSSRCFVIDDDSPVLPALEILANPNAPPEAQKQIESWILRLLPLEKKPATSILVTHSRRRLLWDVAEGLFQRSELYRPVLVLKPEEMKTAALEGIAREIV